MAGVDELLKAMSDRKASDLHLAATLSPYVRAHGDMTVLDGYEPLSAQACQALLDEIIPPASAHVFKEQWDADFAYEAPGIGRFRVNAFRDRNGPGAVFRRVPTQVLTADELGLPQAVRDFCYLNKGLVVVTGPTGSGKSTTLAAMVDLINRTRNLHIITIEDPIEFIHTPRKCLINQREVNVHTRSFANAVRAALREDPDIVLVGEMRDLETMETAIETAETGHLVFGTLHTNTAASTVERMIDKFPAARQNQVRAMLAESLKGVVAQTLCRKRVGAGRVAAMEVLVVTGAVSACIRDGKAHQIPSAMQTGKTLGMQTLDEAMLGLLTSGRIAAREAYAKAVDKEAFAQRMAQAGIRFDLKEGRERSEVTVIAPADDGPGAAAPSAMGADEREAAMNRCLDALNADPDNPQLLNNVAWFLATSANPSLRHVDRALAMAEKALQLADGVHPEILDTLGAAHAGRGDFGKALEAATRGLELARSMGQGRLAAALEQRIRLYRAGRSVRE